MYKQAPKSPAMKALVGNQKNLPAGLKAQIEAAPESPAKQTKDKGFVRPHEKRQMGPLDKTNPHKPGSAESKKYRKDYNAQFYDARAGKLESGMKPPGVSKTKSPAKQTNDQKAKSMEASKEKKVSVAAGASKGKASTNREYVKGGRKKENGSREKSKTTKFSTTDGGKTYTKTTTKGKQGKVKVKTKEISGTKAKRQADRLNKKYTRV